MEMLEIELDKRDVVTIKTTKTDMKKFFDDEDYQEIMLKGIRTGFMFLQANQAKRDWEESVFNNLGGKK